MSGHAIIRAVTRRIGGGLGLIVAMPPPLGSGPPTLPDAGPPAGPGRFSGERLRARRRALGFTRGRLASLAGLTRPAVRDMENNRIRPSDAAYARLSNALGLTTAAADATLLVAGPPDHRLTEQS